MEGDACLPPTLVEMTAVVTLLCFVALLNGSAVALLRLSQYSQSVLTAMFPPEIYDVLRGDKI